jgi:hypothetical protein
MFVFYRKDIKQYTELWKLSSEQMTNIVKDNTTSNVRLVSMIEQYERNAIRKSDIISMISDHTRDCEIIRGKIEDERNN